MDWSHCRIQSYPEKFVELTLFRILLASTLFVASCFAAFGQDGKLIADGNSNATYQLIRASGYNHETPDSSRSHTRKHFQHITQTIDKELGKPVLVFHIHANIDDDRGKANINDRQRNEIKTDGKSPRNMVGQDGETLTMRWKFKLPNGFMTTKKFSHIHQLKGIDNKQGTATVGAPLITLTCYSKGNKGLQVLRLRYDNRNADGSVTLAETDLEQLLGQWVEVEETATFGEKGSYSVVIKKVKGGEVLLSYRNDDLDMWRTGCTGIRPKWGIYRYIGDNREWASQLRDEKLLFADFSIEKE